VKISDDEEYSSKPTIEKANKKPSKRLSPTYAVPMLKISPRN